MEKKFTDFEMDLVKSKTVFGLTGGMGSGKSSVSEGLREKGVVIVDADQIVRDLQQPGQPALLEMATILGEDIIQDDGFLDRKLVATRIFNDFDLKTATEKALGIRIKNAMFNELTEANPESIITLDVPLLLEAEWHKLPLKGIVVVDTTVENAVQRLIKYRGFDESEARQRIATQMPREQKLSHADFVVSNDGNIQDLEQEINSLWGWMNRLNKFGNRVLRSTY